MNGYILKADNISAGYDGRKIISDVTITVPENKISVILGANGCGKSTMLKTFSRLLHPTKGKVLLNGNSITSIPSKKVAKHIGLLHQTQIIPEGIKVTDLITRGRFPYRQLMKGMLLDEPTTFLDISYQVEILDLLYELNKKEHTTIVMVLHDINLSARYADYIFAMKNGKLIEEGVPEDIITSELIEEIYGLKCSVIEDPLSGTPLILPIGRHKTIRSINDRKSTAAYA